MAGWLDKRLEITHLTTAPHEGSHDLSNQLKPTERVKPVRKLSPEWPILKGKQTTTNGQQPA